MILPDVRDGALAAVRQALHEELGGDENEGALAQLAENLVAIAREYHVRIAEELLPWIHYRADGKQWTSDEFRRWCGRLVELRAAVERLQEEQEFAKLCTECFENVAQRTHEGRWWCMKCGVVE